MYYKTSYPSLLSGISQQLPQSRLPGQVNAQTNMVSDLVRGVCRRGGIDFVRSIGTPSPNIQWLVTRIGGEDVLLCIDRSAPGTDFIIRAFTPRTGAQYSTLISTEAATYLAGVNSFSQFSATTVSDTAVLVCNNIQPTIQFTGPLPIDSNKSGYCYVASGAYSQDFTVKVRNITTGVVYTASIQTPNGTSSAHVVDSTPDSIAEDLVTALVAALPGGGIYQVFRDGAYIFIKSSGDPFEVLSDTSTVYLQTSNRSTVKTANVLPARLPSAADGYTVRVGSDVSALHYRYNASTRAWLEDAQPDKRAYIKHIGLTIRAAAPYLSIDVLNSYTRAAGDDVSNPVLACSRLITGVTSFQGRLVLLSDQYVCMSATNDPAAWFRSTVTAVLDSDPIEVALTTAYSAPYQSGAVFDGNLLILADTHQVQVPGDVAITPSNAALYLVANYGIRSKFDAIPLGRSLMLPTNPVSGHVGFVEALPPENSEATLRATSVTSHIPTLVKGELSYVSASNTADTVVFGAKDTTDGSSAKHLYIHQYLWDSTEKVHSSWHKWTFQHDVVFAYILEDTLYTLSQYFSSTLLCKISLARGAVPKHYLDYAVTATVTGGAGQLAGVTTSSSAFLDAEVHAFKLTGVGAGLGEVPAVVGTAFRTSGANGEQFVLGLKFESLFSPTAPIVRDRSDNFLASEHIPVVRFILQVVNTGELKVRVSDRVYDSGVFDAPIVPHSALQTLGDVPLAVSGTVHIPARTEAKDTNLQLWTSDYYDFNVTSIEYGFRLKLKSRRA